MTSVLTILETSVPDKKPFDAFPDTFNSTFCSKRDRTLSNSMRRQRLLRSTGSFSFLEEIVVPTPRKYPPLSPTRSRSDCLDLGQCHNDSIAENGLFGQAGEELKTILYQSLSMETLPSFNKAQMLDQLESEALKWEEELFRPASAIPLRSSNPIIMNSAFEEDEKSKMKSSANPTTLTSPKRVHPDNQVLKPYKISRQAHSDHPRLRSASWPALSRLVSSKTWCFWGFSLHRDQCETMVTTTILPRQNLRSIYYSLEANQCISIKGTCKYIKCTPRCE